MASASGGVERPEFEEAPASFKSPVWGHFGFPVDYNDEGAKTVDKSKTICKHCSVIVPYEHGNTTNMRAHLSRHHPDVSLSQTATKVTKTQGSIESAFQKPYSTTSERHKSITHALGLCIAKDMRPYSLVDGAGFDNLLAVMDPRYIPPSRTHLSDTVVPDVCVTSCKDMEDDLAKAESLALTTDSWTSRATESYLTVTVHYVLNWEMKSAVLQTRTMYESHTSANLAAELCNAVDEWKLKRPNISIPVTTDNATNIVNAVNEAEGLGPQIGCFAHTVNLAAK